MDIVYTLLMMFTMAEGNLSSTTTIEITGYESMEACEEVLFLSEQEIESEADVLSFAGMCYDTVGA